MRKLRFLICLIAITLVACNEGSSEKAVEAPVDPCLLIPCPPPCPSVDASVTDLPGYSPDPLNILIDSASVSVGQCIVQQGNYTWVQDALDLSRYYAIDMTTGDLLEETFLVFDDATCMNAVGTEYNYPLHLGDDIFVFSFEGAYYEYTWGAGFLTAGTYYMKVPGGACGPFIGDPATVRASQPSSFTRTFTGPVSL